MRYLTHGDKFACIHGYEIQPKVLNASMQVDGKCLLLEDEIVDALTGWCKDSNSPCSVTKVAFASPDKLRVDGKRPIVEGTQVLTSNGPAIWKPDPNVRHKASLEPLLSPSKSRDEQSSDSPAAETTKRRIFVRCLMNTQPLVNKPYRLYVSGLKELVEGTTDANAIIDKEIRLESIHNASAFLEVDVDELCVLIYRFGFTPGEVAAHAICSNLGLICISTKQKHSTWKQYFANGQQWASEKETAALDHFLNDARSQ